MSSSNNNKILSGNRTWVVKKKNLMIKIKSLSRNRGFHEMAMSCQLEGQLQMSFLALVFFLPLWTCNNDHVQMILISSPRPESLYSQTSNSRHSIFPSESCPKNCKIICRQAQGIFYSADYERCHSTTQQ